MEDLIKYVDKYNLPPTFYNGNKYEVKLAQWVELQQEDYLSRTNYMSNYDIYEKWTNFISNPKYSLFFNIFDNWEKTLIVAKYYIENINCIETNLKVKFSVDNLINWISEQHKNYIEKSSLMKYDKFHNKWKKFINDEKYKYYINSL
jgi:hypothetical protein